jgi:hypothetical protein
LGLWVAAFLFSVADPSKRRRRRMFAALPIALGM